MGEIWTSRYQNKTLAAYPELIKVGITVSYPRFRLGYPYERLRLLAPTGWLFTISDRQDFAREYWRRLDALGGETVVGALRAITERHGGADLVLLCYEEVSRPSPTGEVDWCHRRILADWLEDRAGLIVHEWDQAVVDMPPDHSPLGSSLPPCELGAGRAARLDGEGRR